MKDRTSTTIKLNWMKVANYARAKSRSPVQCNCQPREKMWLSSSDAVTNGYNICSSRIRTRRQTTN